MVIQYAHIRVPTLPNLAAKSKFLVSAKGKAAFNQLHRLLKTRLARDGHQDMNMIGHDHEIVNGDLSCAHIGSKNFDEEFRHAIRLEERSSARCPRGYKECARAIGGA